MLKTQKGFTLIELVMVIVILGILAAVAIPRYIALQVDAREAAVKGMMGTVAGAAAIVSARAIISGTANGGTVTVGGVAITIQNSYPATLTGGIDNAVANLSGFTFVSATPSLFQLNGAPNPGTCAVSYTQPTGAGGSPTITLNTAGCT